MARVGAHLFTTIFRTSAPSHIPSMWMGHQVIFHDLRELAKDGDQPPPSLA